MSLDNPNIYTPKYEKQDESDRDVREIKIDINTYFSAINSFLEAQKDKDKTTENNRNIGNIIAKTLKLQSSLSGAHNPEDLRKRLNEEIVPELLEQGVPLLKEAYAKKFYDAISRLEAKKEKTKNACKILNLNDYVNRFDLMKTRITDIDFNTLSSYIYGIEFFKEMDNKKWLLENKATLEIKIISLNERFNNIITNGLHPDDVRSLVRKHLEIIESYQNVLQLLGV